MWWVFGPSRRFPPDVRGVSLRGRVPRLAAAAIVERLERLDEGSGQAVHDAMDTLGGLLRFDAAIAYGIQSSPGGIEISVLGSAKTFRPWMVQATVGFMRAVRPIFGLYDSSRPEPWQRNRALVFDDFERADPRRSALWPLLLRLGVDRSDQLRALVCDGPSLLGWVGGFRREKFQPEEKRILDGFVPAFRRRLRLERQLGRERLRAAALPAALEAVSAPAFLLAPSRRILHANAAGRALLERDGAGTRESLRSGQGFSLTRVSSPGLAELVLAVREAPAADAAPRLRSAAARWSLTRRERQVLALLARGDANKTIAAALRVAEGTVETFVTRLMHKAQVGSRSALLAELWKNERRGAS